MILLEYQVTATAEDITLAEKYWALDGGSEFAWKLNELAETYGFSLSLIRKKVNQAANAVATNIRCMHCGCPATFNSRTAYKTLLHSEHWRCQHCEAVAQEARRREVERKREEEHIKRIEEESRARSILRERASIRCESIVDPSGLPVRDILYLLALSRCVLNEDYVKCGPLFKEHLPLSPSDSYSREIIDHLLQRGLIAIDPDSDLSDLHIDGSDIYYSWGQVAYVFLVGRNSNDVREFFWQAEEFFSASLAGGAPLDSGVETQIREVWREVDVKQAICYYDINLELLQLPPSKSGPKTIDLMHRMLNAYSLSQVFYFVWRSSRYAGECYLRGNVTRPHATNSGIAYMRNLFERSLNEGWEVKYYRQDGRACKSAVVQALYYTVCGGGDELFATCNPL